MTIADDLKLLPGLERSAQMAHEHVMRLRSAREGLTRQLSDMPSAPTREVDKLARLTADLEAAEIRWAEWEIAYTEAYRGIREEVEKLPEPARTVADLRLIRGYSWRHVVERTGYTRQHCDHILRTTVYKI